MTTRSDRAAWFRGGDAECEIQPGARPRAFRLVLLGPPGVGKGTQAELLGRELGTCHLSTGDLFRGTSCHDSPSPALKSALDAMRRGELVPDDLVVEMVGERARCLSCRGGFLLDGFPRTAAQAGALDAMLGGCGVRLDAVLSYELPIAEIVERLGGRRTCTRCKAVYHVATHPPRAVGVCDACGGELVRCDDDRPEAIEVRMRVYEASTRPLADYYSETGRLVAVSADGPPAMVLRRSLEALGRFSGEARH